MNGSGVKFLESTGLPKLYKHLENHGSKYVKGYTTVVPSTAATLFLADKIKGKDKEQEKVSSFFEGVKKELHERFRPRNIPPKDSHGTLRVLEKHEDMPYNLKKVHENTFPRKALRHLGINKGSYALGAAGLVGGGLLASHYLHKDKEHEKKAFVNGFVKRAKQQGYSEQESLDILKSLD